MFNINDKVTVYKDETVHNKLIVSNGEYVSFFKTRYIPACREMLLENLINGIFIGSPHSGLEIINYQSRIRKITDGEKILPEPKEVWVF